MADLTEKLKVLEEKLKGLEDKNADGNLTIKISRRPDSMPGTRYGGYTIVCSLAGASVAHVANPELWVPRLLGGGSFILSVFAPGSSAIALVEGVEVVFQGEPRAMPDLDAPEDPTWKGPSKIVFPVKQARQSSTPTVFASPPSALPSTNPPQVSVSGTGSSGATPQDEIRQLREQFAAREAALQQQLIEERRRAEEERHKREMDALRAQQQAEAENQRRMMETLREELRAIKNAPPPLPPPSTPSITEMFKETLPVIAPLLTAYMSASAERERRAEERQAELLKAMQSRPAIDPVVKEILDTKAANELPLVTMMQQFTQAQATMASQMMEMARSVAEMTAGPEESAVVKAIKAVGDAFQGIVGASANTQGPKPRRLPKDNVVPIRQAMDGLEQESEEPSGVLAQLRAMFLAREDPEKVAIEAVKAFPTTEFQEALQEAGDPQALFQSLLGDEWIVANLEYVQTFGLAFTRQARKMGLLKPEETTDEGDDASEG